MDGRSRQRLWLWLGTAATAVMIFAFSAQPGDASGAMSSGILQWLFGHLPAPWREPLHTLLRKLAHLSEYALLGGLLLGLVRSYGLRQSVLIAWAAGTGYAVSDELHQLFVPGRAGLITDVLIDSLGVLLGIAAVAAAAIWRRRRRALTGGKK